MKKHSKINQIHEPVRADTARVRSALGMRGAKQTTPALQDRVLLWQDSWRKIDRVLRWQGPCLGCGAQTWSFDDGDNDPRGILGDSAFWGVDYPEPEDRPAGPVELEIRACPVCANDEDRYHAIQREAIRLGYSSVAPYNYGKNEGWGTE